MREITINAFLIMLQFILFFRTVTGTETTEDVFGKCDGVVSVQRGWLTEEMVVQFKLRDTGLNIWKRK